MKYQPLYHKEDLLLGNGDIIVVTGWTPKERVHRKLNKLKVDYSCIGSLYNPFCGLSPLVANLIASDYEYPIHILSCTRQDRIGRGSEALRHLLEGYYRRSPLNGSKQRWEILSSKTVIGEIDGDFQEEDLKRLCYSFYYWTNLDDFYNHVSEKAADKARLKEHQSRVYLITEPDPEVYTGINNGVRIEGETIAEAWVKALHAVYYTGESAGKRRELLNVISVIKNEPEELYTPSWLSTGREEILKYCYSILHPQKDEGVEYTYGGRIFSPIDQIERAVQTLVKDLDSNRAVISLWIPEQDSQSSQPPCLISITLKVYKNKLVLTAVFRSHDIYTAYCSNLAALRYLQETVCQQINALNKNANATTGDLVCISQAAHAYKWSLEKAKKVIEEQYSLKYEHKDEVGNFIVSAHDTGIDITHTCPKGRQLDQKFYPFDHCDPLYICRDLERKHPTIKASHLAYIALEIDRAMRCNAQGLPFAQDKPNSLHIQL